MVCRSSRQMRMGRRIFRPSLLLHLSLTLYPLSSVWTNRSPAHPAPSFPLPLSDTDSYWEEEKPLGRGELRKTRNSDGMMITSVKMALSEYPSLPNLFIPSPVLSFSSSLPSPFLISSHSCIDMHIRGTFDLFQRISNLFSPPWPFSIRYEL